MRACAEYILWKQVGFDTDAFDSQTESHALFVAGWLASSQGERSFVDQLRKFNPECQIHVRRKFRRDLGIVHQLRGRRIGFVASVLIPAKNLPFKLPGLSHSEGLNFSTRKVQRESTGVLSSVEVTDSAALDMGFIDEVWSVRYLSRGDKKLRQLERFLETRTFKIIEFLKNVKTPSRRLAIAERFITAGPTNEISARFALAASPNIARNLDLRGLALKQISQSYSIEAPGSMVPTLPHGNHGFVSANAHGKFVPSPKASVVRIDHVRVQAGSTIYDDDRLHVIEQAADPRQLFVSGQWDHVFGWPWCDFALVREFRANTKILDSGGLLSGRNDSNWYHWIIEYLPRLREYSSLEPTIPLLVSSNMNVNFRRALDVISSRPVLEIPRDRATRIRELWVSPPVVQVLDTSQVKFEDGLIADTESLLWLRREVRKRIEPRGPRLIFLRRRSVHRGLLNERDVELALNDLGFVSIDIAGMSFDDQVAYFAAADVIVGAGGAVMANYLFAKPGAQIIALASDASAGFVLPAVIASVAEANFSYCFGQTVQKIRDFENRLSWMHSDFTIRVSDVLKAVSKFT